jgi:hypothetical protein
LKGIKVTDKKHKKALKRSQKKREDKKKHAKTQEEISKKMGLFDKLPENCHTCSIKFPKTKDAHMTWNVTVWSEEKQVVLTCPACQQTSKEPQDNEQ